MAEQRRRARKRPRSHDPPSVFGGDAESAEERRRRGKGSDSNAFCLTGKCFPIFLYEKEKYF